MASTPSYRELLDDATKTLYDSSPSPRIDAEVLLQDLLEQPLAWLIAHGDTCASAEQVLSYNALIEQRRQGKPVAYLTGHKEFWALDLKVNEHVLIPRADTETLVEVALEHLRGKHAPKVLDLGTGSGAIALALAYERSDAEVLAVDSSDAALQVARQNRERHKLDNVRLQNSHWFREISPQHFDLIVSNPPYVANDDPHLSQGDLRFEPKQALQANNDGLSDLQHIVQQAASYLARHGSIILEHGSTQGAAVMTLLQDAGFQAVKLHHDLNQLERCCSAQKAELQA